MIIQNYPLSDLMGLFTAQQLIKSILWIYNLILPGQAALLLKQPYNLIISIR